MTEPPHPAHAPGDPPATLRVATGADIATVVALVQAAYRGASGQRGWTTEADLIGGQRIDADMLAELMAEPDTVILVAEHSTVMVGCCAIARLPHTTTATLGLLAVEPDRQGEGIGDQLVNAAAQTAQRLWQAGALQIQVIDVRHELIEWYRRRGFEPTGATAAFPYGDDRFGKPRVDNLRFAVLQRLL